MKERHRDDRSARWLENAAADARYGLAGLAPPRRGSRWSPSACWRSASAPTPRCSAWSTRVLFKPLPFPEPERIVRIWETPTPTTSNSTTTRNFVELQAAEPGRSRRCRRNRPPPPRWWSNGEPIRLTGRYVSADHFAVFGVQPMIGRGFRRDEDQPGAAKVVHAQPRRLAAPLRRRSRHPRPRSAARQRAAPGDRRAAARRRSIASAARPLEEPASFWRLNAFDAGELAASMHWLNPVGRLKPGVTLAQAAAGRAGGARADRRHDPGLEARLER